uniref:inorganic diphosphatase n=1 Tax=Zooxanthella nutricula TaxID=1333877 RepID=A0A7S2JFP5_9DINO
MLRLAAACGGRRAIARCQCYLALPVRPLSSTATSPFINGTFEGNIAADGALGTPEYRLHFKNAFGKPISPWHDIRLQTCQYGIFNAVIEIPKMTTAKMEVATKEVNNPIAQDMKKGKVREYHGPIFWNYGLLPQTWEDPNAVDAMTGCKGDNHPLDVVEIGSAALPIGTVVPVKPLGILAMIDEGELDWKVIAIAINDPLADELDDLKHLEEKYPEVVSGIREWFRWYKTPDGKPLNTFGFEDQALPRAKANEVISEAFDAWRNLRFGKSQHNGLWTQTVTAWTDGL